MVSLSKQMDVQINNKPIEYYFGKNIVLKPIGKCVKYYIGGAMLMATNCGLLGGMVGGIIGAGIGATIVIASPIIIVKYLTS